MNRLAKSLALGLTALLSNPCSADFASGTGFAVTPSKLVTNYHVVKGCSDVAVITSKGFRKAKVLTFDEDADLALLHSLGVSSAVAPLRQTEPRLGEWVGVFGFPLTDTLTVTGNFTDGVVSALRGISENAAKIQFTAPIQPGNSGGPLLDGSGNVIGVVVSRLVASKRAKGGDDIPQNVNFAVSPDLLKAFLIENKVSFGLGNSTKALGGERIAAAAKDFTYRLMCEPSSNNSVIQAKPSAPPENIDKRPEKSPVVTETPAPKAIPPSNDSNQASTPRLTFNWDAPPNEFGFGTRYLGIHVLHERRPARLVGESIVIQLRRCLYTDSRTTLFGMQRAGGAWSFTCAWNDTRFMKSKKVTVGVFSPDGENILKEQTFALDVNDETLRLPIYGFAVGTADYKIIQPPVEVEGGVKRLRVRVRLSADWLEVQNQDVTVWATSE